MQFLPTKQHPNHGQQHHHSSNNNNHGQQQQEQQHGGHTEKDQQWQHHQKHQHGQNTVFVGGISYQVQEDDLKRCFRAYGEVEDVFIVRDRNNNYQSKGYGFVTFADQETAKRVKDEEYIYLKGKTMNIGDAYRGGGNGSKFMNGRGHFPSMYHHRINKQAPQQVIMGSPQSSPQSSPIHVFNMGGPSSPQSSPSMVPVYYMPYGVFAPMSYAMPTPQWQPTSQWVPLQPDQMESQSQE